MGYYVEINIRELGEALSQILIQIKILQALQAVVLLKPQNRQKAEGPQHLKVLGP